GPTGGQACAFGDAALDQALDLLPLGAVDDGAEVDALLARIADLEAAGHRGGDGGRLRHARVGDQHARRRVAGLTGVVEAMARAARDGGLEVRVVQNDVCGFAAELLRHALDGRRGADRDIDTGAR